MLLFLAALLLGALPGRVNAQPARTTLTVVKDVPDSLGLRIPLPFQIRVSCTNPNPALSGPDITLMLTSNRRAQVPNVPVGSVCTVSEPPPAAPSGSQSCPYPDWTTTYSPAARVTIGRGSNLVVVTNRLVCRPGPGRLVINKQTNFAPASPQNMGFPFTLNCNPGGQRGVSAANGQLIDANMPAPATCTEVATPLPPAPTGCSWRRDVTPLGNWAIVPGGTATINVTDTMFCKSGYLEVRIITHVPPGVPQFAMVGIRVYCPISFAMPGFLPVPANGNFVTLTIPAYQICSVTQEVPPAPAGCIWRTSLVTPGGVPATAIPIESGVTLVVTITNDLVCNPPGTLIIRKVTPLSPAALSFTAALLDVNCSPGGPVTTVSVPANGQAAVSNIPAPATCTIVERPLPAPAGCAWVPTQIPAGTVPVAAGATITVTVANIRLCGSAAGLVINKRTIVPPSGAAVPESALFNVACSPGGPNTEVPTPANGLSPVLPVAGGASCTVAEQPPPARPGCAWIATQAPPGSVTTVPGAVAVVDVTDNLVCNPSFGTLAIVKRTTVPQGFALPASFLFNVNCGPRGLVTTVSVPANGQTPVPGIMAPAICAVAEQAPPPPSTAGCSWAAPTQVPPGSAAVRPGATATVTVANQLVCNLGNLIVRNVTTVPPGMQAPAFFPTSVSCGSGGSTAPVSIPANNQFGFLNMPAPRTCTVSGQVPPPPAGCAWTVTQVPTGSVTVASGATVTVTITNQLVCGLPPASATLLIRKFVMVNGATTPSSPTTLPSSWPTAFPITATCGSHPPIAGNLNGANNYQTSIAASVGETCTVQEAVPTFPLPNCRWAASYPQGPSALIAGGTTVLDIYNEQVCS